jgi:glutathione synthase/RimK-type ligase-like ATP-grasp enzyme
VNTEDIPDEVRFSCDLCDGSLDARLFVAGDSVDLNQVRVVLFRQFSTRNSFCSSPERTFVETFCNEQWSATFQILRRVLDCVWLNDYGRTEAAYDRLYQLQLARSCGFTIPATLITNDPQQALTFGSKSHSPLVVKALHHHRIEHGGKLFSLYTREIEFGSADETAGLLPAPCLVQQRVAKKAEIRVTIFGTELFAVEIGLGEFANDVDVHSHLGELPKMSHMLPAPVKEKCLLLMTKMGLRYAALDLVIDPNGDYVFLEINPDCGWSWLEPQTKLPLTTSMVNLIESSLSA